MDWCIPKQINSTHICLVPKTTTTSSIRKFRPISLSITLYKIITKVIVFDIKHLFPDITGPTHSSFLTNHQASDNALVVQEILNFFKTSKQRNSQLLMKIDLEKAFDCMEWSFIHDTLVYICFCKKLIKLIMSCVSSIIVFILHNGTAMDHFTPTWGIHQGYSLSPYIFILFIERLLGTLIQ